MSSVPRPVRELAALERPALQRHLLALGPDDRRLRFGTPIADSAIGAYVARIDFDRDAAFGVFDEALSLLGAAHLARSGGHAELGVSVLPGYRGQGVGAELLRRAVLHARNWQAHALFMHCLRENRAMMHLARKQGMAISAEAGEADAWLELAQPDAGSFFGEAFEQRVGVLDYALKAQIAQGRRVLDVLTSHDGEIEQGVAPAARH